jgi:photosystem II stability/assembly factor-like uncharacterized protein
VLSFRQVKESTEQISNTKKVKNRIIHIFIFFFLAVTFVTDSPPPPSGWYQQFMPDLGGRSISDITFLDSLIGYATAYTTTDTNYLLKTIDSGNNWSIVYREYRIFNRVQFLNQNTGYICGGNFEKTTNGGATWTPLNAPPNTYSDMSILNPDTMWLVSTDGLTGGVYRTTNGGASWDRQLDLGSQNPNHIYMFNGRIGFICEDNVYLRRTTNGGLNWEIDTTGNDSGFRDMYFVDSLTGWKTSINMRKTTNGGLNWYVQTAAQGGIIQSSFIYRFSNVNRDTLWGVGGYVLYPNNQIRGIVHRTINGGTNWLFQIPDTSIHIGSYGFCDFVSPLTGWAYVGIHTTTGGDTIWYIGIQQMPNAVPEGFVLKQNYPNPFNPRTVIPYSLSAPAHVKIIAYDITGREVQRMVDNYQQAGAYEVDFMGKFTASGVYFYRMTVTDEESRQVFTDTKKMILLK